LSDNTKSVCSFLHGVSTFLPSGATPGASRVKSRIRILHREHRVAIQILIAIHEHVRHQRLMPFADDHEMHVRRPIRMPRRCLQHVAHRAVIRDRIVARHDGPEPVASLRVGVEARAQRRLVELRQLHVVETFGVGVPHIHDRVRHRVAIN
jgi:hypothetical protein